MKKDSVGALRDMKVGRLILLLYLISFAELGFFYISQLKCI